MRRCIVRGRLPACRMKPGVSPRRQRGMSLLEVAITLTVGALMTVAGFDWASSARTGGASVAAQASADAAREALASFARTNHRLPCPDLAGTGLEGDCADATVRVGWLPVVTLGMSDRNLATDLLKRPRYAVYRGTGADLVHPANALAVTTAQALSFSLAAAASAAYDNAQPIVARSSGDCAAASANVAFVVHVPVDPGRWAPSQATSCFVSSQPTASETAAELLAEVTRS